MIKSLLKMYLPFRQISFNHTYYSKVVFLTTSRVLHIVEKHWDAIVFVKYFYSHLLLRLMPKNVLWCLNWSVAMTWNAPVRHDKRETYSARMLVSWRAFSCSHYAQQARGKIIIMCLVNNDLTYKVGMKSIIRLIECVQAPDLLLVVDAFAQAAAKIDEILQTH